MMDTLSEDDRNDDDENPTSPEGDQEAPNGSSPDEPQALPSQAAPKPVNSYLSQYLAAKNQANQNRLGAGLTAALGQLTHGISGAQGNADLTGANILAKNADSSLNDYQAQQKAKAQDALHDPNSQESKAFRQSIQFLAPEYGDKFGKITAADQPFILKPLELKAQLDQRKEAAADRSDALRQNAQLRADAAAERSDIKKQAAQEKDTKEHEAYVTKVEDRARGWRGDPASTRFDQNLAAVSTADAILSKYRGREDEMTMQDIHTLIADKLRAATGAAPTEPEIAAQLPSNMYTKYAGAKSFFTGAPEPAHAGAFVKNLDSYFKDMEGKSLSALKNRQKTVVNSPRLSEEEKQRIEQIGVPEAVYKSNSAAGGTAPPVHPQDSDAVQWAKSNPNDPRSAKILQLNGAQ